MLAAQAAGGAAIAIERVETQPGFAPRHPAHHLLDRASAPVLAPSPASLVDLLYPRGITGFGGVVSAGTVDQYPPGTKTTDTRRQVLARQPHGGAGRPRLPRPLVEVPSPRLHGPLARDLQLPDPATGQDKRGWFRCPCHGSTYNDAGVRVFGPAPRSMDRMDVTSTRAPSGSASTPARITKGTPDNAKFAVKA